MRREEFEVEVNDPEEFNWIMQNGEVGHLGMADPHGFPRVVPVNFVSINRCIYFHGASAGEKFLAFKAIPKVSFSVDMPYSIIPSYWAGVDYACPITVFFKSVLVRGYGKIIDDITEKAMALQSLMEKYQPEGGYKPIKAEESLYRSILERTAVFRIDPWQVDIKVHFGQNLSTKSKLDLIAKLEERNRGPDKRTAGEIRKALGRVS